MILKWIFLGNILTMGYKCTLLSCLLPIRYEATINTLSDLDQSGLPLLIPRDTTLHHFVKNDPRSIMKRTYNKSVLYVFSGRASVEKVLKLYILITISQ